MVETENSTPKSQNATTIRPRYGHESGDPTDKPELWGTKHTPLNEANFLYKSDEHCYWVKEGQPKWLEDASVRREFIYTYIYSIYIYIYIYIYHIIHI